jgi:hypothetical protein
VTDVDSVLSLVDFWISVGVLSLVPVEALDGGVKGTSVGTIVSIVDNGWPGFIRGSEVGTLISTIDEGSFEGVEDFSIVVENVGSGSSLEGDGLLGITVGVISLYVDFELSDAVDGSPLASVKVLEDVVKGISFGAIISIVGNGLRGLSLGS